MYEIHLTCYDPPYTEPSYEVSVSQEFKTETDATLMMFECIIDETENLNLPDVDYAASTEHFVISRNFTFNGCKYAAAVVMWDGAQGIREQLVTGYNIVWVNKKPFDEYNRRLREMYGGDLTVWICSDEDDDGQEYFYYRGSLCGTSEYYDTAEEAFAEAISYLESN